MPAAFVYPAQRELPPDAIIVHDIYESFYNSGEIPDDLVVPMESSAIRSILHIVDNRQQVESIVDGGSQTYRNSANGSIFPSLGLARNVPFRIGDITLYLQKITEAWEKAHDYVWKLYMGYTTAYYDTLAKIGTPPRVPPPSRVVEPGTPPPSLKQIEGFILHMARNARGLFGEWPCKKAIQNYLITFFAIWVRHTGISVSVEDKKQAGVYMASKAFLDKCPSPPRPAKSPWQVSTM
ncbi:hypothetical protein B0H11DRAFT_2235989 [Mycena galericulata]|nr:hypothetical protein B0H11DRAFT_2235989 [Mycena galericulata]